MKLRDLKNKKIVILGFGKEGKDSYLALKKLFPQKKIAIADQCLKRSVKHWGKNYLKALKNYDLIIKAPGIPLPTLKPFIKKGAEITSQTEIFFDNFPGTIIGVTGTKGKGTTASLIYHILKENNFKAHLVGNIGKPVFQKLLEAKSSDIFIYELSSHQLQGLKKSPHIAVFLNFFPDHLDYYKNLLEYQKAKENIALYQTENDFFIYNGNDKIVRQIAQKTRAKKVIDFSRSWKMSYGEKIPLKGRFNLLNVAAAIQTAKIFNIPVKKIKQAVKSFKPLPHRLEFIGKYKGIEFYDDSMSTIPEVTIAGLEALGNKVKTLIVGGSDKGSNYKSLAKEILRRKIKTLIIFLPGTGPKIWRECLKRSVKQKSSPQAFSVKSMPEAVKIAYQQTKKGEICLLSPASASFNLFKDYRERGNLFKKYVKLYGSKK